jgi:hypothetical protein
MFLVSLFSWWYVSGWVWLSKEIAKKLYVIKEMFSVSILLRTLFSPWKQIQTPSSFRYFFQAAIDNLVSRFIGSIIRTFMLIGALIASIFIAGAGVICLIAWPFIPLLPVILPVMSILGVKLW